MLNFVIKTLILSSLFSCLGFGNKIDKNFKPKPIYDLDENKNQIYDKYEEWVEKQDFKPRLKKAYLEFGKTTYKLMINANDFSLIHKDFLIWACLRHLDKRKDEPTYANRTRINKAKEILYDNDDKMKVNYYISSKMAGAVTVIRSNSNKYCLDVGI